MCRWRLRVSPPQSGNAILAQGENGGNWPHPTADLSFPDDEEAHDDYRGGGDEEQMDFEGMDERAIQAVHTPLLRFDFLAVHPHPK